MNFYQQSSITTQLTLPTTFSIANQAPVGVSGWQYLNCVAEPYLSGQLSTRALSGQSLSSSQNSVEWCANQCAGYQFFGLEYSQGSRHNPIL